jgi:hypothetical protein
LVVAGVPRRGPLVYYSGSAWDRAGQFADRAAWAAEVQAFARRLAQPVKVKLAVAR